MTIEEQLVRDEGLRLKPYVDQVGKITIGVGRNLSDVGISATEAQFLFANDLASARQWASTNLPVLASLDEVRQGALVNMSFNMHARLLTFSQFLRYLKSKQFEAAADEMLNSMWAREVGSRAIRLSEQIRTGVWV